MRDKWYIVPGMIHDHEEAGDLAMWVLIVTGEYTTGMVRSSLMAVPRRFPVLAGKVVPAHARDAIVLQRAVQGSDLLQRPRVSVQQEAGLVPDHSQEGRDRREQVGDDLLHHGHERAARGQFRPAAALVLP